MEFEVSYSLDNADQFWEELDDIVSARCDSHEAIDNTLRSYLSFASNFHEEYLQSEEDIKQCACKLLGAPVFYKNKPYVRRQFVFCLLQEDEPPTLEIVAAVLLLDGLADVDDQQVFHMMKKEGAFPRLVELIKTTNADEHKDLHRLLLQLVYEMSRIQRLAPEDIGVVDDAFVLCLFQTVEELFGDPNDPFCYHVIRVLLVLNEQYFVANIPTPAVPLTNRVIKALSTHGHIYKTFGENMILLLNRETEASLTLLILKLLYLLFLNEKTCDYFYTNDLHVLIDIIIRNLLDLPSDDTASAAIRHTYLRVLHPLLANSQVNRPPHYKPDELLKMLDYLSQTNDNPWRHFEANDETTIRLAKRLNPPHAMAPSSTKAALKAAKAALDAQKWNDAIAQAEQVLESDPHNYFARLFLGRALDKKGSPAAAATAYDAAAALKPDDDQAWLGLRSLYEGLAAARVDEHTTVGLRLAEIYAAQDDAHRAQIAVDKAVDLARAHGSKQQYKRALELYLPTSAVYGFLEGRVPHPAATYTRIADIVEAEEKERVNKEIGERRTRLGARIGQVTTEVKREVYGQSPLEELYQSIVDWTGDDEVRRAYEEKLLLRAYEVLAVLPSGKKDEKREQVVKLAHGMVIIKHPFALAWRIELEWRDVESFQEFDANVVREFVEFFPDDGLARVLKGYLTSEITPFPLKLPQEPKEEEEKKEEEEPPLSAEDRLLLMTDGLDDAKQSTLAHRLMGEYYLHWEEVESSVEVTRKGLKLLTSEAQKSGLGFQNNKDAINSILATSLIQYQSPKNHPEAKSLFHDILKRKQTFTPALIGVGLILEEEEEYSEAIDFLSRALARDPENARIGAETAWCKALTGDHTMALSELERHLEKMKTTDPRSRELRALTLYRIGICIWETDPTRQARKDRTGAYASFIQAIKTNPNLAPAYTSLGIFYQDYARDKKRARQCFQKAFELTASELEAAERLARSFADQGEWEIVEVIAQRAIDSGKCRPAPGSKKKKGVSWPFSAMGIVQMNKQEYNKSVYSFLSALRISPNDYHSYVGLGESYHNSGRYNSALRTFRYAEDPTDGVQMKKPAENWFTKYMLANVNRELGQYDEAIDGYKEVLETRPNEFGVQIALLQTLVERGWRQIETSFFGKAADSALEAIDVAKAVAEYKPEAFNLWKAVGDACSLFSWVQSRIKDLPFEKVKVLLETDIDPKEFDLFSDNDGIGQTQLSSLSDQSEDATASVQRCLESAILAQKRAIYACAHDIHAQAVAWYNLGWTEYRTYVCCEQDVDPSKQGKKSLKFLKAAMRCFKRAIELEAGNAEFWNALGIVTTQLNPKVAQHSIVRSLHLNERNVKAWVNLGTLCLLQNDYELAHTAFARAQSTDPDYAQAWLGEGLIALLWGDAKEALSHFTHAFEISDAASLVVKRQYAVSTFDHLLSSPAASNDITKLIQPLFALQQLYSQKSTDIPHRHLAALYLERVGNFDAAIEALDEICTNAEAEFEVSESPEALSRFAQAKTDLARNRLAASDFSTASEDAETALDLTSEEGGGMSADTRRKVRLAARLTAGLSQYYLNDMDAAIDHFRTALQDSGSAPDVVCSLAEVLWAKGGAEEKNVARDQLFECVADHPDHVGAVVLLGATASLDEDSDTMDAVRDDLQALRTRPDLDTHQLRRIEKVLDAIASLSSTGDQANVDVQTEIQTSIMLAPHQPHGWSQLADLVADGSKEEIGGDEEVFPAKMALVTAKRAVPPHGPLSAEELAQAFAGAGTVADTQRAVMCAPWRAEGWNALGECIG
ncbi:Antiviral protein [Neofusicoccum parvum]|uniref:Antiviral protein n=1 Tax=Neofusicoccum parvum TaxID=310453 RepID=A0ACB5SPE1_9PEZI|nr:Antiviral protein [Neofusicoccum parvum]